MLVVLVMLVVVMVHHHGNIHAWIHHDRDTGTLLTMSTIVGGYRTHVIRQVTWSSTTVVAHGMIDTVNTSNTVIGASLPPSQQPQQEQVVLYWSFRRWFK